MIRYCGGDLFLSGAEALVCPVNCVGTLGAGLAKLFHVRWPLLNAPYRRACQAGEIRIGTCWTWQIPTGEQQEQKSQYVICVPTKVHWQKDSEMEYVEKGAAALAEEVRYLGLNSVAVPALGCGLGGLQWEGVREVLGKILGPLEAEVLLYPPGL